MKEVNYKTIFCLLTCLLFVSTTYAVQTEKQQPVAIADLNQSQIQTLNQAEIAELFGRKLRWKEKIALKYLKKRTTKDDPKSLNMIANLSLILGIVNSILMPISIYVMFFISITPIPFVIVTCSTILGCIISSLAIKRIDKLNDDEGFKKINRKNNIGFWLSIATIAIPLYLMFLLLVAVF